MNQLSQSIFATRSIRSTARALYPATADLTHPDQHQITQLIDLWLDSLDEEDLAGTTAVSLASVLWVAFAQLAHRSGSACQLAVHDYQDGRGDLATALLIVNRDMPFLVDSIVMALRRMRIETRAVLNAVLAVERDASGHLLQASSAAADGDNNESHVLILLKDALTAPAQKALSQSLLEIAADAAAVQRDTAGMRAIMCDLAQQMALADPSAHDAQETAAFLQWANAEGFEAFGYAYYRVQADTNQLQLDTDSRRGVLRDAAHPLYETSLAGIPEDRRSLIDRQATLAIVKADVQSTLHRDQQLDYFGVRQSDANAQVLGEHCFIGLFSRAAMSTPLSQTPFARGRVAQVLQLAGVRHAGFRREKFLEVLESLPRTEVLEASIDWLATVCSTVVALYKQPRSMVFVRPDEYGRHLNVFIYMPRERYSAQLAERLASSLRTLSAATDVRSQIRLSDGPLARLHLIANLNAKLNATAARRDLQLDTDIAQPLLVAVDGWHSTFSQLIDGAAEPARRSALRTLLPELPGDYQAHNAPAVAFADLSALLIHPQPGRLQVRIDGSAQDIVNIRLLAQGAPPALSQILPLLHNAGVAVEREQTYAISGLQNARYFVTVLKVDGQSAAKLMLPGVADVAEEFFSALLNNEAEDGRMNGLVIEAGLRLQQVQMIRAYASYWRQAGCRFSLRYIADCLRKQPAAVRALVDGFLLRFDPALDPVQRSAGTTALQNFKLSLADINHADTEDILRSLADLMLATLRTSYFQRAQTGDTILFKFDSSACALLPHPRPYREMFVFSRRFEGVHLRGGPVARGGLRWSDRMEDYRTEVLGLVKAQMVKNAVIVPAGAKGGFVCKMLPADAARELIAAEGEAVYRLFIAGLLDLTDNRVDGSVIRPAETVCYDDDDPYLVVAADKGTATFSDIANGIAIQRGFWLGDAFASGGSNGYDHKKLGITAKGAWEAVKRHFYELDHDLDTTPISVVGVGDMSGDVFGNGVLLSRQIRLVAAFDHRHVFIDPNPDLALAYAERARLFALPRSSWDDYDKQLISAGGGVWARSARSIPLSPQVRALLDTDVLSCTPDELLHAILLAPVDLFYNGGIGTYIKASSETHLQVKDRANDAVRVDGAALRCKVVAEGGNLGATQAGRIEFALMGGRLFTDAIDNSAGVDCSDHEVNVKIWLDAEVNAGSLAPDQRTPLLTHIAPDIEALVLRDNRLQTHLLAREEQGQVLSAQVDAYAALIADLEAEGVLVREQEYLPTEAQLQRRKAEGRGLSAPELAVVSAYVKNRFKRLLAEQPLTAQPWARALLTPYFPPPLVAARNALDHPLANAILATVLANEVVNRCGPLMVHELASAHRVDEVVVIQAWAKGWDALHMGVLYANLDAHALHMPRHLSQKIDQQGRIVQRTMIKDGLPVEANGTAKALDTLVNLAQPLTHSGADILS